MPAQPSKLLASLSIKVSVVLAAVVLAACGGSDAAVPEAAVGDAGPRFAENLAAELPTAQAVDDAEAAANPADSAQVAATPKPSAAGDVAQPPRTEARRTSDPVRVDVTIGATRAASPGEAIAAAEAEAVAPTLDVERVGRAVVRVEPANQTSSGLVVASFGSGSIIDAGGFVLTNWHVVDPAIGYDVIVIAITSALDAAPVASYIAEIVTADATLDLAVLRLTSDLVGNPFKPQAVDLSVLPLADSDGVEVLDGILAFGYPDIGDETLTVTAGAVSGFLSQPSVETRRAWFKTDTTISFGNSGGAAIDEQGMLVAIPTQGRFDEGGSIAHLRPVNFALPLIEAALRGEIILPAVDTVQSSDAIFDIAFGTGITEAGELTDPSARFPSGTTAISYGFQFQGMVAGTEWVDRWQLDGVLISELSGARPPWDSGESGTFLTAIENRDGFVDGVYTLGISVAGVVVATRSLVVGEAASASVQVTSIEFASGVDSDDNPIGLTQSLPAGLAEVFVFFEFASAGAATTFDTIWYRDGVEFFRFQPTAWDGGDAGSYWISLFDERGFAPGSLRVDLLFDGVVAGRRDISVGAAVASAPPNQIDLALGATASGVLAEGQTALYRLTGLNTAAAGSGGFIVELSGDGDADLYVKAYAPPLAEELNQPWDTPTLQAPYLVGSNESVVIVLAGSAQWFVLVAGVEASNAYTLTVRTIDAADGASLTPGSTMRGQLDRDDSADEFTIVVPDGAARLTVTLSGDGDGDADLYLRFAAPVGDDVLYQQWNGPTIYAPFALGTNEVVSIPRPQAGVWYVLVDGFELPVTYSVQVELN